MARGSESRHPKLLIPLVSGSGSRHPKLLLPVVSGSGSWYPKLLILVASWHPKLLILVVSWHPKLLILVASWHPKLLILVAFWHPKLLILVVVWPFIWSHCPPSLYSRGNVKCLMLLFDVCSKTGLTYTAFNHLYCVLALVFTPLWFSYFAAHTVFLIIIITLCIWNGATFYVDVFSVKGFKTDTS